MTLNWNRPDDTIECLASLTGQVGINQQLIVVDNGSTDNSIERIREAFPQVEVITIAENLYFGGGANVGLQHALAEHADYVLLINNDAYLASNTIATLLSFAEEDVGILAPMIYYASQPNRIWSIGGKLRSWVMEHTNDARGNTNPGNLPEVIEQDFVTSCCVLFPRKTLEQVGLYDAENFTMYYEDSDLCLRVRQAGLRILVIPAAKAWHKVALSSGGSDSPDERYWMARSSLTFFRKHIEGTRWLIIIPYRLGSAIKTSLRLLLAGRIDSLRSYWKGLSDGIRDAISK